MNTTQTTAPKHTAGPWTHTPMQDTIWANDGDTKIATVADLPWVENPVTGRRHSDFDTEQANARLIAAAPDLLNALELAEATIERLQRHAPGSAVGTLDVVRAAIAKATQG